MLLNLPVDFIITVSSYLPFSERLNLSLVNRQLQRIINQHTLHQAIVLDADQETTSDIIGRFTRNVLNGNPVKRLEINLNHLSDEVYRQLPDAFPNVTYLVNLTGNENPRGEDVVLPMQRWANTLEEYDITKGRLLLDRFMLVINFPHIQSLTLSSQVNVRGCLRHMPALQYLHIYHVMLNIAYFEDIHRMCPELKSLKISNAFIRVADIVRLPPDIQPLNALTSLVLEKSLFISDRSLVFLDYIIEKYINLEHLEFLTIFNALHAQRLVAVIAERNIGVDPPFTIQEFEDTRQRYQNTGGRFLERLPTTINKFTLELSLFDNAYTRLLQPNINLTELHFNGHTNNPNIDDAKDQIRLFRKLINLVKITATFDDVENPFTRAWSSTLLETMNITIRRRINPRRAIPQRRLNFVKILTRFPSLKDFNLDGDRTILTADDTTNNNHDRNKIILLRAQTFPNLRKLQLKNCMILPVFLFYLRHHKADIDTLDYSMTKQVTSTGRNFGTPIRAYSINLPNYRLETLRLSQLFELRDEPDANMVPLYIEVNAGNTVGRYHLDVTRDHQIINMADVTNLAIIPEENEHRITITVTLENLVEFKLEGHPQNMPLHANHAGNPN